MNGIHVIKDAIVALITLKRLIKLLTTHLKGINKKLTINQFKQMLIIKMVININATFKIIKRIKRIERRRMNYN
jgi:predicted phage-related endonuclease